MMASHTLIRCSSNRERVASWNIRDLREKYNLLDYAGASYPPHPASPIAPRLKFNHHIHKALLDVRLAPDLTATPERAMTSTKYMRGRPARDANSQSSACLLSEAPVHQTNDIDHKNEGEHGQSEPDTW